MLGLADARHNLKKTYEKSRTLCPAGCARSKAAAARTTSYSPSQAPAGNGTPAARALAQAATSIRTIIAGLVRRRRREHRLRAPALDDAVNDWDREQQRR